MNTKDALKLTNAVADMLKRARTESAPHDEAYQVRLTVDFMTEDLAELFEAELGINGAQFMIRAGW